MPSITQLEYLIAVEKERHFGRAAQECHVSQPSLSTQIQKLEEELNCIIFDRSKKPILLTEVGKLIVEQAKVVLREHKRIFSLASESGQEPMGSFSLAVIPTLAPYLIPHFVGQFSKKFPKVKLQINEYKTEDIIKKLVNDEIDAGLLVTPLHDERIIERHLFFEKFYAYVSEDHPLNKKKILNAEDLRSDQLWVLEEGHCFRNQVLNICSRDRKTAVLPNVEFASGNLETLKNLVKKNSGFTIIPKLAMDDLDKKEVETYIRKIKKPVPTREVSLVHSRSFLKENIIEAMEKEIIACIPNDLRSLKKGDIEIVEIED